MKMQRVLVVVGLVAAGAANAQTIAGRVTDRTSGNPVAGVVVSALDANGNALARVVTDSASGYRVPLVIGIVKLHFRRIGYSPTDAAIADSANGRLDVVMTRLPTQLAPVKATVAAQCDAKANTPDVIALWEQARLGLLTSIVARESKAGYTSVLAYHTDYKGDDEQPREVERVELPPGVSVPFIAGGEPDSLAKYGYMVREGFQNSFLGPDDRVLFDVTFLTTHCFTSEGSPSDSLIGIRFQDGKGMKAVGVEGVLWLRRDPLDIVSVQYNYTNLDRAMQRVRPGGSIQFRRMPNGITMITEWRIRGALTMGQAVTRAAGGMVIRLPANGRGGRITSPPRATTRVTRDATAVANETGAMIEMMQWPDSPPYVAPLATVSGVLIDKYSKRPLTNTPIRFYRTPFKTTTDSTGAFRLVDILPGVYEIDAGDFKLEEYGAAPDLIGPIAIKYGANTLELIGESPEAAAVRGCSEKMDNRVDMPKQLAGKNAIFGLVEPLSRPPKEIEFRAEVIPAGAVAGTPGFPLKGKTDKAGRFRICGLPNGRVKLTSRLGSIAAADSTVVDPEHPYRLVRMNMKTPPQP